MTWHNNTSNDDNDGNQASSDEPIKHDRRDKISQKLHQTTFFILLLSGKKIYMAASDFAIQFFFRMRRKGAQKERLA